MVMSLTVVSWLLKILILVLQAIRDGNKIWATLKTDTNQDGHFAQPITAPSGKQQLELLERIYKKYKVNKDSIQVIEAHGNVNCLNSN